MSNPTTFQQASTVLNSIYHQATGKTALTTTEADFISVATTALSINKDKVYNALIEVIGQTIFSIRRTNPVMRGLEKDLSAWGAFMRKIGIVDSDMDNNNAYAYPNLYDATGHPANPTGDGLSLDPWVIKKRDFLETYFTGQSVFSDHYTLYDEQLETAFQGPEQLVSFIALHSQDEKNKIERYKNNISRTLSANLVASLVAENNPSRVVKLVTLYNTELGLTGTDALDSQSVLLPENFKPFEQWAYSKIAYIASMMREDSLKYQTVITGKPVIRNTPYNKQHFYMLASDRYALDSRVLADAFHDNYLKYADVETVNFWQSIDTPAAINMKPTYTNTSGAIVVPTNAVSVDHVFALLFDDDTMGWRMVHHNSHLTPMNPNGEYRNVWHNMRIRTVSDNTEKAVVFLLE